MAIKIDLPGGSGKRIALGFIRPHAMVRTPPFSVMIDCGGPPNHSHGPSVIKRFRPRSETSTILPSTLDGATL